MNPDPIDLYAKLQPLVQKDATDIAVRIYEDLGTKYGVAEVPFHLHNNIDSPAVPFSNLLNRLVFIHWTIPGTQAATATNYGVFWTAPVSCNVVAVTEVHQTAGTAVGTVSLNIEKLTSTQAPGAGVDILRTAFNLKDTANTVQTGDITTAQDNGVRIASLAPGDRLCLNDSGTLTTLANVTVMVTIQF